MAGESAREAGTLTPQSDKNQQLVETLTRQFGPASTRQPGHPLSRDLAAYEDWLDEAHRFFREATRQELTLTYASEWVLDNYYIIRQALDQIDKDLPQGYYAQLPKLTGGKLKGFPRVYAMTQAVLSEEHLLVNIGDLQAILIQVQQSVPLTMGELWAVPIFLRYSIIEGLSHALEISLANTPLARSSARLPGSGPALPEDTQPNNDSHGGPNRTAANAASNMVANSILSLRAIADQDWNDFFDDTSRVEQSLRKDPLDVYAQMDFKSRDLYRKEIEALALAMAGGSSSALGDNPAQAENDLAESALEQARESLRANGRAGMSFDRRAHVGYYLLGQGRSEFEARIGYRPTGKAALKRWAFRHNSLLYIGGNLLLAALLLLIFALPGWLQARSLPGALALGLLLAIPALTISASLVNWLVTLLLPPASLPKLAFREEIPAPFATLVTVPAMLTSQEEITSLVQQIEMHYLRNTETGLRFALLTDFGDADREQQPEDDALVALASNQIEALNDRYPGPNGERPFYFMNRPRTWNPAQGRWMGWERKRGKLNELNHLLLNNGSAPAVPAAAASAATYAPRGFSTITGDLQGLNGVRFVITLDADTVLPRSAARRLVGALAHPLNQAIFDERTGRVTSGYTLLQPRMEISPTSAISSWFTRLFAGDLGLDLYTLAVSDAHQDLFGEGIYVGKGIYDVAAFERSVAGHIPDNHLLSHDLLEGLMGRAGLVTDITMIEDYPPNYFAQSLRQRRWIRGDWQLLPWLLAPGRFGVHFPAIARWKIFDNLRRSLLMPGLVLLFVLGMLALPEPTGLLAAVVLLTPAVPLITSLALGARRAATGEVIAAAFHSLKRDVLRWLLAVTFMLYEGFEAADAILVTLYRMVISRRHLLEWTTAAHAARLFRGGDQRNLAWQKMGAASVLALLLGGLIAWLRPAALPESLPLLLLWLASPLVVRWINQPIAPPQREIDLDQALLLRRIARRTWAFFEHYVGPEDHWLPPDHFQETPVSIVAHRTSPTNIGMMLTSIWAAYDMGYIDPLTMSSRLSATLETLDKLERFRGHFINWYDTLTLQPLRPRYVSTVDSGNLSASLIITAQASRTIGDTLVFRWEKWQGFLDILSILDETLSALYPGGPVSRMPLSQAGLAENEITRPSDTIRQVIEIQRKLSDITGEILAARDQRRTWYNLFKKVSGPFWEDISARLANLIVTGRSAFSLEMLRSLESVAHQVESSHIALRRTIDDLEPWVPLFQEIPELLNQPHFQDEMNALQATLPYGPPLGQVSEYTAAARPIIARLAGALPSGPDGADPPVYGPAATTADAAAAPQPAVASREDVAKAQDWLDRLTRAVQHAAASAETLIASYDQIAAKAEQYVDEMDFAFLYNPLRRIFHIGYNIEAGQLDGNYYDLLASESRIASLIAIARREVQQTHWMHLNRPVTEVAGRRVLLSWSATMFEYLMPPLFLPSYPGTLLAESSLGAVLHQIAYGKSKGVPWGISESGFYRFDANQNYQYRAFGAPGLGFKRGLGDDLVIAPYASLMAVGYTPQAVVKNVQDLIQRKALGIWGFYEAIDFTPDRLLVGETSAVVKEYMAHHQGMILMAMANFFHDNIMVRRMNSDPRMQSVYLLLQEQAPLANAVQSPYAEDVKGVQRLAAAPVQIAPWTLPVQTPIPQVHLLSNGSYSVILSNAGGGYSSWKDTDLTRWQPDGVQDSWGAWIYLQDLSEDAPPELKSNGHSRSNLWSAGYQPIPSDPGDMNVTFFAHMAVFRRAHGELISNLEVTVAPDDPVEIRRVTLNNTGGMAHRIRLTSYGEVILTQQATDARHPAFNRLFIEEEWVEALNLQVFKRRPRSDSDQLIYLAHALVVEDGMTPTLAHEADRARFIGRGGSPRCPAALTENGAAQAGAGYLSGSSGATLDPIFALGQEFELAPHLSRRVAFLTLAAASREELLSLAARYTSWAVIDRSFHQANLMAQSWLGQYNINTQILRDSLQVLSALVYPFKAMRAAPDVLAANRLGQSGLWRFGISGDYPILVVKVDDPDQLDLVREALQVHRYLRSRRYRVDVVILNMQMTDYGEELNGMLHRLAARVNSEQWLNQRGGIFILHTDQMNVEEHTLLETAARVVLSGQKGPLSQQLPGYSIQVPHLPDLLPTREPVPVTGAAPAQAFERISGKLAERLEDLQFFNGYGGFSADGQEYILETGPGKRTPAPWVNVIGYPQFGFMVSESGSQNTWAVNSGENRLTPWSNDPVRDTSGEVLYLRDEETGDFWSATPMPASQDLFFRVRHGAGYTIFEHESHGLTHRLTLFASPEDPVKIAHLAVKNTLDHPRRITITQYVEFVLGVSHAASQPYLVPEYDAERECLLVRNTYNNEFADRVAFLSTCQRVHGVTADRAEFIGRNGSLDHPAAMHRLGLETRITPGEDICGVLQAHLDLMPGQADEAYFVLGEGSDRNHALALADKYREGASIGAALDRTHAFWHSLLDTIQVKTPDPAANLILNRWLLYQALSCRVWGRTAFYQASGAFGFRDQLQDVLALLPIDPTVTRGQILNAAAHQFDAGDVLHWWHPPTGRGVRTRISDDLLWLPYVTALYLDATGDWEILTEKIPFLTAPALRPGEVERYGEYPATKESATLFEHCLRAIDRGATSGPRRLPLIGAGDWNDGYNRVGVEGRGESIWLAWFLNDVLNRFAAVCEQAAANASLAASLAIPEGIAARYRKMAGVYADSVETVAWDGDWYRRAFYDDGSPLGSASDPECQIDAIAQSWAVISGAGRPDRSRRAMQSVLQKLVRPADRLALLFTPPFDQTPRDPGYIKGYLPGTRENGGQYTHAAIWNAWAFTCLGDGQQAGALFDLLNPVYHANTPAMEDAYRVEPYVICADIYSVRPYLRRGGWTWYTGSAAWMYRLGLEAILGLTREPDRLCICPVIPPAWDGFQIDYHYKTTTYHIQVSNPAHVASGVKRILLDGQEGEILLTDDGKEHQVQVEMGAEPQS